MTILKFYVDKDDTIGILEIYKDIHSRYTDRKIDNMTIWNIDHNNLHYFEYEINLDKTNKEILSQVSRDFHEKITIILVGAKRELEIIKILQ